MPATRFEQLTLQQAFARDVFEGFTADQKWLPARWFYDDVGSALFEAITFLPEYGLTRADARILERYAPAILESLQAKVEIIELGSGSGSKTRWLLEAAALRQGEITYSPIDVSATALEVCAHSLGDVPGVSIIPRNQTYLDGVRASLRDRAPGFRALVLFLGSTIGNFSPPDAVNFLGELRRELEPGDALLLGTDLVKPVETLIAAYDDPVGVTAAFNRNILARINRELGGQFNPRAFEHEARYVPAASRIEMHLRSLSTQEVLVRDLGRRFRFVAGETIWTESSHKFTPAAVGNLARQSGFVCSHHWDDPEWPFSENLLVAR